MEMDIDLYNNAGELSYLAANPSSDSQTKIVFKSCQSSAELLKACVDSQVMKWSSYFVWKCVLLFYCLKYVLIFNCNCFRRRYLIWKDYFSCEVIITLTIFSGRFSVMFCFALSMPNLTFISKRIFSSRLKVKSFSNLSNIEHPLNLTVSWRYFFSTSNYSWACPDRCFLLKIVHMANYYLACY